MTTLAPLLMIAVPVWLLVWLGAMPQRSVVGFTLQAAGVGAVLLTLALTGMWGVPPWWSPYIYGLLWLSLIGFGVYALARRGPSVLPEHFSDWSTIAVSTLLLAFGVGLASVALDGRRLPAVPIVDIPMPLGQGSYLIANGGSRELINPHMMTLAPEARFIEWRGQSYGLDIIAIDALGFSANGWRPRDPSRYAIFGRPVYAPCDGTVLRASDGQPDMPVPETDRSNLPGNHVILGCGDVALLLAHLRRGSVQVATGAAISQGTLVGEVGNSGNTTEPHLHIHAQRVGPADRPLSADPLALRIEGRFLVRNDHIGGRSWPAGHR